ncbi:PucR family transcriptional regulator [Nocardia pseudovaccinii]|uniref:PucR family transcriptional regulator n=1 Tax=Nocardia pseudovaccinii TaxID=189540 RepID=UPI003D89D69F
MTIQIETAALIYQGAVNLETLGAPAPAFEYARHLARREAPPSALARAYRWGQFMQTQWAIDTLTSILGDPVEEVTAFRELTGINFWYIDHVSELVLAEYQAERDRWLAHRNTVKAEALTRLLDGSDIDVASTEKSLGYPLRTTHVAGVIWVDERHAGSADIAGLESAARKLATSVGVPSKPLFWLRDPTTAWWWISPSGDRDQMLAALRSAVTDLAPHLRVAVGPRGHGVEGFRESLRDALLAEHVARVAGDRAPALVAASDQGVRAAALLATDLEGTRRLVRSTLGDLAADTRAAADLRLTLKVYLEEGSSHIATAKRLHIHKNTVGYRLGKITEACGSTLQNNRVDLELALVACERLGAAVLSDARRPAGQGSI